MQADLTWGNVARVWWLLAWRSAIGGALLGMVIGFVLGFVGTILGYNQNAIGAVIVVLSVCAALMWSMVVVKMMLKKQYRGFHLSIVKSALE